MEVNPGYFPHHNPLQSQQSRKQHLPHIYEKRRKSHHHHQCNNSSVLRQGNNNNNNEASSPKGEQFSIDSLLNDDPHELPPDTYDEGGTCASKECMRNKRARTIFTPDQLERMEQEFQKQQYVVGPERLYLAASLNLTEAQVKVWFQNRRIKWRKHHMISEQSKLHTITEKQDPRMQVDRFK